MSEGGADVRNQVSGFRRLVALMVLVCCAAGASGGDLPGKRVGTLEKETGLVLPVPPLAVVSKNDRSGKTWQQTGSIDGALPVVSRDFRQSLQAAGWSLDKTIKVGEGMDRMELAIWTRSGHRVLVMIWEKEPGQCGFSWGEER